MTCNRDTKIDEVAQLMRQHHVGDVVVIEESKGRKVPVGVLTDRDIVTSVIALKLDPAMFSVGDLITRKIITVREDLGVFETIQQMRKYGVRRMPVLDQEVVERFGWCFQTGDKVIQTQNDYDKDVFNGDIGIIEQIDPIEQQVAVRFDGRLVEYDFGELDEVALAYAITIHKAQGSEFPAVVIPLATQHYLLLQRNLIYTGITRGKRLLVLVGQRKALAIAVRNDRPQRRHSGLLTSLRSDGRAAASSADRS